MRYTRRGLTLLSFGLLAACAAQAPTDESRQGSHEVSTSTEPRTTPVMGWSTAGFLGRNLNEAGIKSQARVLANRLKSHGYDTVLVDDFWYANPSTTVDAYGRWVADASRFPNGLAALADHLHGLGLKVGFYVTPGIPVAAVEQNTPIEGTSLHAKDIADTGRYETNYNYGTRVMHAIDYSKPGAQEYVQSWANQLAAWGADFLKLDGVNNGNVGAVQAWSQALRQTGRAIHFNVANSLDANNGNAWKQHANSWRVDADIACFCATQVTWSTVVTRFGDVPKWVPFAGANGWNDLDALNVANGHLDGLTNDERRTYMTLWAISAAPLYAGDDLTHIDNYGWSLLTNDEVIAIDQAGHPAHPVSQATNQQVWAANHGDGTYTVALFNLASTAVNVTANWNDLGFSGSASVRDVWDHRELGSFAGGFGATLDAHATRLLKVTPATGATRGRRYEAESSANTLGGSAVLSGCVGCSGGQKIGYLGYGGTLQFNGVEASAAGTYVLTVDYTVGDSGRSIQVSINGGAPMDLPFTGTDDGAWSNVQSFGVPVVLQAGSNTVTFANPSGWAPDIDRITVNGAGYVGVVNRGSGKYLDVSDASTADRATIEQSAGRGRASQQWALGDAGEGHFKVVNRNSGKWLSIPGPTTTQGTQLIQSGDDGSSNAQWALTPVRGGYYDVVSRYDGQNMDTRQGSSAVVQWADHGGSSQQWSFVAF
ncbi:RICIN domain-containing protein [Pendulispora brunnea]|uniref:Alpha-galactosidase n=1 Tax=Pendulispora brunnea TaxID=2905690 RepID=A0ABZ2K003_9BACT